MISIIIESRRNAIDIRTNSVVRCDSCKSVEYAKYVI